MRDPTLSNNTNLAMLQLEERKRALLTLNIKVKCHQFTTVEQATGFVDKTVAALDKRLDSGDLWEIDDE